jgi:hypothetical protein
MDQYGERDEYPIAEYLWIPTDSCPKISTPMMGCLNELLRSTPRSTHLPIGRRLTLRKQTAV